MATEGPSTLSHPEQAVEPSEPSIQRCPLCNPRQEGSTRNLVVCIDGTCNEFGQENTNVVKLFAKIDLQAQSPKQFAYYSSGIGADPNSRRFIKILDMAVGWNIKEIIKDAYRWLAGKYEEGDQIYLFGFSRGAYQVRVLAGMIHEVGLIRTPTEKQIRAAYDYFEAIRSGKPKTRQIAREFKNTFSWKDARVHFVGVWDTVSSVGLIRGDLFLSTSSSAAHACHFRHALALDECRVKFMPEYFHEMNSQRDGKKSKCTVSEKAEHTVSPASGLHQVVTDKNPTYSSVGMKNRPLDIKEVWFAGCHSDVGGTTKPGMSHRAGNVSLLWMRREAKKEGLELKPTDLVWVPADLDFGTSSSMSWKWRIMEYLPIKHQMSFSGPGEDARRRHRSQPRRIIPGQKLHASILYASAYTPQATLGKGLDISIQDTKMSDQIWETGLFDDTAAPEIMGYLDSKKGDSPIYLERLLFILRFEEGKKCVRNVDNWQGQIRKFMNNKCAPIAKLIAIVAYFEASFDSNRPSEDLTLTPIERQAILDAKQSLDSILTKKDHRDGPKVVALLRPLMKHQPLRGILSNFLEKLVLVLDEIVKQRGGNFGQAMEGLACLVQYEDTRKTIFEKLGANDPDSNKPRLLQILKTKNPQLLTAALRMVLALALARTPAQEVSGATRRNLWSTVRSKLAKLAKWDKGLVGPLAVEILLAVYDPNSRPIDVQNKKIQANLGSALVCLQPDQQNPGNENGHGANPRSHLRQLFGLDADALTEQHQKLLDELKKVVQKGNTRECTASTMTLLKLCESTPIREYLCRIHLLDLFIDQLRHKDKALVAAYALAACLKQNMGPSDEANKKLPKNIVDMLRLDYFDDAVGSMEGFQIFQDLMSHDDLRKEIKDDTITKVLNRKLGKGKLKEIRTSLICLDIFRSLDEQGPWTRELVGISLQNLRDPEWKVQRAGVTILSALARTDHGVAAIGLQIEEIVKMLLPRGYLSSLQTPSAEPGNLTSLNQPQAQPAAKMISSMMGPACALRILAQNPELRRMVHDTHQYHSLKHLYSSGTLVDKSKPDTPAWRVNTPNRSDVDDMLDKMIKAMDEELSEEGLIPIDDNVLPHIQHWDRLVRLIRNGSVVVVAAPPVILGLAAISILSLAVSATTVASVQVYDALTRLIRKENATNSPPESSDQGGEAIQGDHASKAPPGGHVVAVAQVNSDGEGIS